MNIQMSELMMSSPHNFRTHFIYKTDKNLKFQLWECKPCLISTRNKWEIMFKIWYILIQGVCFYLYLEKKNENIWQIVRRWHHQLTHLNIHNRLVKKYFPKKLEISKCHNFLISYPIFIIFAPICREIYSTAHYNSSHKTCIILDWT